MIHLDVYQRIQHSHAAQEHEIVATWWEEMNVWLRFSPKAAKILAQKEGLDSPDQLHVLTSKNINDTCNIIRKPEHPTECNRYQSWHRRA